MKQQIKRPCSFIDSPILCRPLLTSSYTINDDNKSFISLPYNYLFSDIKKLQPYLSPNVKLIGVDFTQQPKEIKRIKYRTILVKGKQIQKGQIYKQQQNGFEIFKWSVDVAIPLLSSPQQKKQQLHKYLLKNLQIVAPTSTIVSTQAISNKNLKQSSLKCQISISRKQVSKNLNPTLNIFTNKIPVFIVLPKLQDYQVKKIIAIVAEQISQSISIMLENQIFIRRVGLHQQMIPIQCYFQKEGQVDKNFQQFNTNTKKSLSKPEKQKTQFDNQVKPQSSQKNNKIAQRSLPTYFLIALLGLVVLTYFALKYI